MSAAAAQRPARQKQQRSGPQPWARNWLFIGEAEAGQRSAILTIIENRRRQSIDPYCYLKEVLSRLPDMLIQEVKETTSKAWTKKKKLVS